MNQFPNIPTQWPCNVHIVSAHGESHKFLSHFCKEYSVNGWIEHHCFEPKNFKQRHDEWEAEINRRKKTGEIKSQKPVNSPLKQPDFTYLPKWQQDFEADPEIVKARLMECPACRERIIKERSF